MSRDDVRTNLRHWESHSDDYQATNEPQLNRWTHEQRRLPIRQRLDDAPGRANTRQLRESEL